MEFYSGFGGNPDTTQESERAQHIDRVTAEATNILGNYERARQWIQEPNFAFGGAAPQELLKNDAAEYTVIDALRAQVRDIKT